MRRVVAITAIVVPLTVFVAGARWLFISVAAERHRKSFGDDCVTDGEWNGNRGLRVNFSGTTFDSRDAWCIAPLRDIIVLRLSNTGISSLNRFDLASIESLNQLYIRNTNVDDGIFSVTRELSELRLIDASQTRIDGHHIANDHMRTNILWLAYTDVDDAGVANIVAYFRNLEILDLNNTAISDTSARGLSSLSKLCCLSVKNTSISDQFLSDLNSSSLRFLHIGKPSTFSEHAIDRFNIKWPECQIRWELSNWPAP